MILYRFSLLPETSFIVYYSSAIHTIWKTLLCLTVSVAVELSMEIYVVSSCLIHILPSKTLTKPQILH